MDSSDSVPQPGPAHLPKNAGPDEWLEQAKQCKYLPESDMKKLCEIVKECLMEGEWCFLGGSFNTFSISYRYIRSFDFDLAWLNPIESFASSL